LFDLLDPARTIFFFFSPPPFFKEPVIFFFGVACRRNSRGPRFFFSFFPFFFVGNAARGSPIVQFFFSFFFFFWSQPSRIPFLEALSFLFPFPPSFAPELREAAIPSFFKPDLLRSKPQHPPFSSFPPFFPGNEAGRRIWPRFLFPFFRKTGGLCVAPFFFFLFFPPLFPFLCPTQGTAVAPRPAPPFLLSCPRRQGSRSDTGNPSTAFSSPLGPRARTTCFFLFSFLLAVQTRLCRSGSFPLLPFFWNLAGRLKAGLLVPVFFFFQRYGYSSFVRPALFFFFFFFPPSPRLQEQSPTLLFLVERAILAAVFAPFFFFPATTFNAARSSFFLTRRESRDHEFFFSPFWRGERRRRAFFFLFFFETAPWNASSPCPALPFFPFSVRNLGRR